MTKTAGRVAPGWSSPRSTRTCPRTLGDTLHPRQPASTPRRARRSPARVATRSDASEVDQPHRRTRGRLIEDGSTLQMGIGGIPDAVLRCSTTSTTWASTPRCSPTASSIWSSAASSTARARRCTRARSSPASCMGTPRLYDFVAQQPAWSSCTRSEYINDPFLIAQNDRMVAINSAIEVDLTGQVCADSIGHADLQRHRRAGGLHPRRGPLQGRQAHHRPAPHRHDDGRRQSRIVADAQAGRRRGDHARPRPLRRHRARHRRSLRQVHPPAGDGAHQHRPPRLPRRTAPLRQAPSHRLPRTRSCRRSASPTRPSTNHRPPSATARTSSSVRSVPRTSRK